jgi:RNA polymerase sigma-70 factor (ECF subfamily)
LYSSLDKPLIRFSNKYLNCTPDAEDVVHDVFVQFWLSKYTFSDIKSIRSFLFTATKNKTLNYLKRKRRVVNNIEFLEFEAADERPVSFFDFSYEIKSMFETSLGQLPEQCEKIMKSFKDGLNSIEIAIRFKLAPSTVRAQKRRGIKLIRTFFSSRLSSQLSSRYL